MELRKAVEEGVHILTMYESDSRKQGFFDFAKAGPKYEGGDFEFLMKLDTANYRRDRYEARAMLEKLFDRSKTHEMPVPENPINEPGHWDYFLSHGQGAAGDQVNTLAHLLEERGKKVWYDMNMMDRSAAAMLEGVANRCDRPRRCRSTSSLSKCANPVFGSRSANFILFLSGDREFQDTSKDIAEVSLSPLVQAAGCAKGDPRPSSTVT
jgi:hypothetical protein